MGPPTCPSCKAALNALEGHLACDNGHAFTPEGLALASNQVAVSALWLAIKALQDDAVGLEWLVRQNRAPEHLRENYLKQAAEGRQAADVLRRHAQAAHERLESLPTAPSNISSQSDAPS